VTITLLCTLFLSLSIFVKGSASVTIIKADLLYSAQTNPCSLIVNAMKLTDGQHSSQLVNVPAKNLLTWYLIPIIMHRLTVHCTIETIRTKSKRLRVEATRGNISIATAGYGSLGLLPLRPVYEKLDSVNELLDITR
jgi:hypothetical protein